MTDWDMAQGLSALATGFLLGLSLILAIGPQNAFVLRQGLLNQHVLPVVLFCALSDALLIGLGIAGDRRICRTIQADIIFNRCNVVGRLRVSALQRCVAR